MKGFIVGLLVGILLSGTAARALGISVEGLSIRSLIATMLMAGSVHDLKTAHQVADELLKLK